MKTPQEQLRDQLARLSRDWIDQGLPSRRQIEAAAGRMDHWKQIHAVETIWSRPPVMLTATLDDGMGHGLMIIRRFAATIGLTVNHLGLLKKADEIILACQRQRPEFLGLTVLQLDSDDDLCRVGHGLPADTRLIAGGPVFKFDPDMGSRCNVSYVAHNVACFIDYLLKWSPRPAAQPDQKPT